MVTGSMQPHGISTLKEYTMSVFTYLTSPAGLRRVLWFDAISGVGTGVLQVAASGPLSQWLGLPESLLRASGIGIFAFVALAAWLAMQRTPSRAGLAVLVVGNFAWAIGCLWLALGGAPGATNLGVAYFMVQVLVVAVLAELQWMGLRQSRMVVAA
jgi:hypothetical protein